MKGPVKIRPWVRTKIKADIRRQSLQEGPVVLDQQILSVRNMCASGM